MKKGWIGSVIALVLSVCPSGQCETHYVSPHGSDEAPYLTPETAARSIWSATEVASHGDIISVAPGDYGERVLMQSGLMLVGSGQDSTRILGSVRAGPGTDIRYVTLAQEAAKGETGYVPTAIEGPTTGGLTVVGCRISGTYETGISCQMDGGYALIQDCEIRGIVTPPVGEGIGVWQRWGGRPLVCVVDGCVLENNGTGLAAASSDGVWVMRTRFAGNGTGIYIWDRAEILGCRIDRNFYGVSVDGMAHVVMESCALTRNTEHGLWCGDSTRAQLTNCTISDNARGLSITYIERVDAKSCIVWRNSEDVVVSQSEPGWSTLVAEYCDIGRGWEGSGNVDADPLFVDPAAGDYRLRPESPCIDTGSDGTYYADQLHTAYDLDGKRRFVYGGKAYEVDMGAYEYHINRLTPGPGAGEVTLTWSSYHRTDYSVFYSEDLVTWHLADDNVLPAGYETISWTDDGSLTGLPPLLAPKRFYRLLENP